MTTFPSLYAIGQHVTLGPCLGRAAGTVVGVSFTESKVLYDLDLDVGGETLRGVDSAFFNEVLVSAADVRAELARVKRVVA